MADEETPKEGHNSKSIDFKKVAALMTKDMTNVSDKLSKSRGDMSAVKNKIEEMGANKRGANFVYSLMNAGPATASDILRTVVGLCEELEIGVLRDMVDVAEGKRSLGIPIIETPSVDV